ncbi:MAG: NAD-dependent epimerase/dehydratase family protein [Halobacteriota archaeon]
MADPSSARSRSSATQSGDADRAVTDQTIVVTGGAGFIGSHLAEAFVTENDVTVVDNCTTGVESNVPAEAQFVRGDIRDAATIRNLPDDADIVFHHAGIVSVEESYASPRVSHDVNVGATLSLLEYARRTSARLVFASSCAIYGAVETTPISESHTPSPQSPYGVDKLAADNYVRVFGSCYDVPVVVLRYFNVYGPRQSSEYSGVIDVFGRQATSGDPITIDGDGTQTRDFVHVSDVVDANRAAAVTDATGRAYNVGTGVAVSIEELAHEIKRLTDSDSEIVYTDPRPGDVERSRADLTRSRAHLGYEPTVDLTTGLRSTLRARTEPL